MDGYRFEIHPGSDANPRLLPLVAVHGLWADASTFETLLATAGMLGIEVVAITLPHHFIPPGVEPLPPMELTELSLRKHSAPTITKFIRDTYPDGCNVWGHSAGGLTMQLVAGALPDIVKGVMLMGSAMPRLPARCVSWALLRGIFSKWRYPRALLFGTPYELHPVHQELFGGEHGESKWSQTEGGTITRECLGWVKVPQLRTQRVFVVASEGDLMTPIGAQRAIAKYHGAELITHSSDTHLHAPADGQFLLKLINQLYNLK